MFNCQREEGSSLNAWIQEFAGLIVTKRFRAKPPWHLDTEPRRRKWRRGLLVLGAVLLFLAVAWLSMLHLFRPEVVEQRLLGEVRRLIPGSLTFGKVSLRHLPVPRVTIRHLQWQLPGKASLSAERLVFTVRLLPLLRGKVEIASLQVEHPIFHWLEPLASTPQPTDFAATDDPFGLGVVSTIIANLPSHLATAVAALDPAPSELRLAIRRGELILAGKQDHGPQIHLRGVTANLELASDQVRMDLSCSSGDNASLSLKSELNLRNLTGECNLDFHQIQLDRILPLFIPSSLDRFLAAQINGKLSWSLKASREWVGSLDVSLPKLVIRTQEAPLEIRGAQMASQFHIRDHQLLLSLDSLAVEAPLLHGSGFLQLDQSTPRVQIGFQGWDIDASSLRHGALSLMREAVTLRKVFTIVQGGMVPWITWNAQASTLDELGDATRHIITGGMRDGGILIPNIDLLVSHAQGQVRIVDGVLTGERLSGRTTGSQGTAGNLLVGLLSGDPTFHLDIRVDADLKELHQILTREIANPGFHAEMNGITEIQGRATGRMVLGESTKDVNAWVDVSDFHLSALYQRVPYPVMVERGRFYYGDDTVTVTQLEGSVGNSVFAGLTAWIACKSHPRLKVFAMNGKLSLPETYSWLMAYPRWKTSLPELQNLQGFLWIGSTDLDVPLSGTDPWPFQVEGQLEQVTFQSPRLPEPMAIDRGMVVANRQQITIQNCRIHLGDGDAEGSVQLRDPFNGTTGINFDGNGTTGEKSTRWIEDSLGVHAALHLKTPLRLSDVHTKWSTPEGLRFSGTFGSPKGAQLAVTLSHAPDGLNIRDLLIQGSGSNASIMVSRNHHATDLTYRGTVTGEALNQIFESNPYLEGWMYGEGKVHLEFGQQTSASAQGTLMISGLDAPWWTTVPLRVESAFLSGSSKEIRVESATVAAQGNTMQVAGKVGMDPPSYQLDLNVKADSLDWNGLERIFEKTGDDVGETKPWDLPFVGTIRVEAQSLRYGERLWGPLDSTVRFHRDRIDADIAQCGLCGIQIDGTMSRSMAGTRLNLQWNAKDQELDDANDCLWERRGMVVGKYNLDGWLNAQGQESSLLSTSTGYLRFMAKDGRIYRLTVLAKILAILNVTEVLRGKLPDLATEGFAYESMEAYGEIRDGHLQLSQATIHGSAMKILAQGDVDIVNGQLDLTVLVAPLKTADVLISNIPLLGKLVTGKNATLLAFPFSVKGNVKDPDISVLPPTALGSGLLDLLRKILP
ncbi:MAG TPA: hypothetical protein DCE18_14835 [Syntrophobacteraceae bacterium]|nr:hypothetical protein [Syntrophobacteraceae bacterium]